MPAALWAAAVALARRHGLYATARSSTSTTAHSRAAGRDGGSSRPVPAFIDLPAARPTGLGPCVIDLGDRYGRRLRIEVTGVTVADLVTLAQVVGGRER